VGQELFGDAESVPAQGGVPDLPAGSAVVEVPPSKESHA
jgi:hypothetical protein